MKSLSFLRPLNKGIFNNIYVGIPLILYENIYTGIHEMPPTTCLQTITLQTLIGFYTYGNDRFLDALEYEKKPYLTNKRDYYESLLDNKKSIFLSFNISLGLILGILISKEAYAFIPILLSTQFYRNIKASIPIIKPFYLSIMWTMCCYVLPYYMYKHNFDCLYDLSSYSPLFFNVFSSSNYLDIIDLEEDSKNNVKTIPIVLGKHNSSIITISFSLISNLLFVLHNHFNERLVENSLFEIFNILFLIFMFQKLFLHDE